MEKFRVERIYDHSIAHSKFNDHPEKEYTQAGGNGS